MAVVVEMDAAVLPRMQLVVRHPEVSMSTSRKDSNTAQVKGRDREGGMRYRT